jgi:hypothetical protein
MFRIQYAVSAILLAGALGLTTSQANAQSAYKGTFNLPYETYWGNTVLEPGTYTLSIEGGHLAPSVLKVKGSGGVATVLSGPAEQTDIKPGRLFLANVNGVYALKQFDAGSIGKSYEFAISKAARTKAGVAETSEEMPVGIVALSIN